MRQLAAVALVGVLALVGCAAEAPSPAPAPSSSGSRGGAEAGAATDPELDAFRAALEGHSPADPAALVAAVEAAGFERSAIERTREVDSLGEPVTFLEVAVRQGESCLLGQVGDGEPTALRVDALGGGRCLVGEIVTVD
ncbi:hypothetical protein L332_02835 [Agrococcus pavilionensis RW1]|uniref:DUF6993 domain-containing protein n=1 Tax=Agrococcus pavilionensis RW1 TaxID=1330458 RepID=U1LN58_9MICO|nr:hypothetical protein [Agrococcus pavilionensis]ERG63387.1 hypothetical protein L332_02835 [Agrococcus pavilionensis RW1]